MKTVTSLTAPCPHCGGTLHARRPPFGEVWDSLTRCHHCDALLWKVAKYDSLYFTAPEPKK